MQDLTENKGVCPVRDTMPDLLPENELVAEIYFSARASSVQVSASDKTYFYIRPEAIESMMRIFEVPEEDRPSMLRKIFSLQDLANKLRPGHPRTQKITTNTGRGSRY